MLALVGCYQWLLIVDRIMINPLWNPPGLLSSSWFLLVSKILSQAVLTTGLTTGYGLTGQRPRRLYWIGRELLVHPVMGYFKTAGLSGSNR